MRQLPTLGTFWTIIGCIAAQGQSMLPGPSPISRAPDEPQLTNSNNAHLFTAARIHRERAVVPTQVSVSDGYTLKTTFKGVNASGNYAADPSIAAGSTSIVIVGNSTVTILDKSGQVLDSTDPLTFFNSVRIAQENAGDPRVIFDQASSRFFISAQSRVLNPTCTAGNCISHFFLAISRTSTPSSIKSADWYFYSFDATLEGSTPTTYWSDFPGLGVNDQVVVISSGAINFATGFTEYGRIRIFDKSKLIRGSPVSWTDFVKMRDPLNSVYAINFQPALHFDVSDTFFLVSPAQFSSCGLIVWGIKTPLSSPTLSSVPVNASGTCSNATGAAQPSTSTLISVGNPYQLSAVPYRKNSLWTARTILQTFKGTSVSAIRWHQLDVSNWPDSVTNTQDSIFGTDGVWRFYPALAVDGTNDMVLAFIRSSSQEFPSVYYTGRLNGDAPGALRGETLMKAGSAGLASIGGTFSYGDYSGAALDPNDSSIWLYGEHAVGAPDAWGTWIGNVVVVGAPILTLQKQHSGTFVQGQAGVQYTIVVTNTGNAGTTGAVAVTEMPPAGLTVTGMSGVGWNCTSLNCTRSDTLNPGGTYPPIIVAVNVNDNAAATVTNTANLSGGGAPSVNAYDPTSISEFAGITFQTNPAGLSVTVDGNTTQAAPFSLQLTAGPHTVSVNSPINNGGTRNVFTSWSDGGAQTHQINVGSGVAATYTATFQTQYQLTTGVSPGNAGTVSPASGSYYNAGTSVPISVVTTSPGFVFANWSGNGVASPNSASTTVTMDAPKIVTANFSSKVQAGALSKAGIFRQGFLWVLDVDGNNQINVPPDRVFAWGGAPGDIPVYGDWNGSGTTKAGVFRPNSNAQWLLDWDGTGQNPRVYYMGYTGDVPVVGDWNGDGKTKIGVFHQGFLWILDTNGNGTQDSGDSVFAMGGYPGDIPLVGDWNGNGISKPGLFRQGYLWILDTNGDHQIGVGDAVFPYGGYPGDVPIVGDWNGSGITNVGIFRQGFLWVLDTNGNRQIDQGDSIFAFGGYPADNPVIGKW